MGTKLDLFGEAYLRVLMRRQLLLSCTVAGALLLFLGAIPLLNRYLPHVMESRLLGLTVSWWVLGVGVFPLFTGLAWLYVRLSNDFEDEAIGMVDVATLPGHRRAARPENTKP